MKKIIHMSDLHIGFEGSSERFQQIMEKLKAEYGDKADEHIIVITGDLVDNANNQESYSEVKSGLEDLKRLGFADILVIPGNHDYGTGSHGDKKFVKLFQQTFYGDELGYPRKVIIDGIAFIGLDSIAEELHWYDKLWSEGELGDSQLSRLSAVLKEDDVRFCQKRVVYLHHHPFSARPLHQLKDSKKLEKFLKEAIDENISIDALLYGHNHQGESHNGQWGIPRCYDAGTVTLKPRPHMVKKLPWFQIKSSVRVIALAQEDTSSDYELSLL